MNEGKGLWMAAALVAVTLAPSVVAAQEDGHATGAFLSGRLNMVNTSGAEGLLGGLGAPAPVSIGFAGESFSIAVGPTFHHFAVGFDGSSSSVGVAGANAVATFVTSTGAGGNLQIYPLVGLGTAIAYGSDAGVENGLFLQGQVGLGARYFLVPNVATHIELGEGLNRLSVDDGFGGRVSTTLLTTWGGLGLSIIFG